MKPIVICSFLGLVLGLSTVTAPAAEKNAPAKGKAAAKRPARPTTVGPAINENQATPVNRITAPEGFEVELLYSVPGESQGSWVALCTDPRGRLIVSDQFGGLYRFAPPAPGQPLDPAAVEKVPADIRAVNGMLWAFDALYVGVNDYERKIDSGLYRITDSDGDDRLDKVEKLRVMKASGDHGIHAILLSPDRQALYLITGNNTETTESLVSRVPRHWGEDHLLPRMPDGRGHNRDRLAPGGIIYRVSPDGQQWEIVSSGFRNIYDGGFNLDGELFTYDADMEYDFNTPWYRPTRVCHVTSGSEWGWRNGTGKRPEFYPDNLPPVVNIGPGSPTGVTFGYGAKFPARYQQALFLLDWSWGKIYAVHLEPDGATYTGTKETFITGGPLPVTDAVIHPQDGAMYFAIGGRRVQSGLYRVTYQGDESTRPVRQRPSSNRLAKLRHELEAWHGREDARAIKAAWPHLDHEDRFIRWAARTAVMHQPPELWTELALHERDYAKRVEALLGLATVTGIDPFHRQPDDPPVNKELGRRILASLSEVDWAVLNDAQRLTLTRAYQICLVRFGEPDQAAASRIIAQLDPQFPSATFELNWLLCETLAFLQAPSVAAKGIALIQQAPTQEEQMEYARSLRLLKAGWTPALRTAYFEWFLKAASYRGGASFAKFIEFIRNDAVASIPEADKPAIAAVLAKEPEIKSPLELLAEAMSGRSYVKEWTLDELSRAAAGGLKNRNFANGRRMFAAAGCFACHRFANEGGMTGPDLSGAGGRYSPHDLLDQIIHPSREINEQFVPIVLTKIDGSTVSGVVVNLNGDTVTVNTDMFDPNQRENIDRKQVKSIEPSKVSPMPAGLLNMLQQEEILDLLAYVLSGGDAKHRMFGRR
jgi:putative heme-binding domain-containing protein